MISPPDHDVSVPRDPPLVDVLIVGAGPAGATAALNLAPLRNVVLIDAHRNPRAWIGEALPPAARWLLTDMSLFDDFLGQGHAINFGNRSVWGQPTPRETDFLRDPDGCGWHLARSRFDAWLRAVAADRGARLIAPARMLRVEPCASGWTVTLATPRGTQRLSARFLVDAGGRAAPLARRLGARVRRRDRLVSHWVYGSAQPAKRGAGFTFVEATEGGWWYTAPLPEKRRVLAFHTDADLESARMPSAGQALVDRVGSGSEFGALLEECRFQPDQFATVSAAHTAVVDPPAGPAWLATGDAALAFDPLSAQGILNALFTGLAAAYTADRCLSGDHAAIRHYVNTLEGIHVTHCQRLDTCYAAETRWPSAPFWRRRQQPQAALWK